ncbi:MAG TPA: hypothetical protein PLU33_11755 [Treponemataceae bacterium]|nr:hypothetical protein [Treponemataceae bacterium]
MFFLLPLIPVIGAAITSAEIISGIVTAVGVGATIKGAVDYHDAKKKETEALEHYELKKSKVNNEVKRVQTSLEKFGSQKLTAYNGVLSQSVNILIEFKNVHLSKLKNGTAGKVQYLNKDMRDFFDVYNKDTDRISMLSKKLNSSVNKIYASLDLQRLGAFGMSGSMLNNSISLLTQSISFAVGGSRAKDKAQKVSSAVRIERERMEETITLCRNLRKRIAEGSSVLNRLSNDMTHVMEDLAQDQESSAQESSIEKLLLLSKTMKKVIDIDICTTEGVLLEKAGLLYTAVNKGDAV